MRIDTPLTEQVGIDLPIVQAPIGGASTPELAAAVSNAGGLGMLSITWRALDATRPLIRAIKALTDHPFGVNLVLEWDPSERLAIALDEGARVISFFWGDPAPYVQRTHDAGALVAFTVGSAEEARRAVDSGVDIIVAQGWEAGGHVWGSVATLPLVPSVVDAVPGTPVIAAGGIADGRGLAAVLALGAAGGWLGTRFLLSDESAAHELYREKLRAAAETDPVHTGLFDVGWSDSPMRALRNSTFERWLAAGQPAAGSRSGEGEIIGYNELGQPVERYSSDAPLKGADGEIEAMVMYAGQSVGSLRESRPAGEIVREIAEQAIATMNRLNGMVEAQREEVT
jgi:nitronate monooxygenase